MLWHGWSPNDVVASVLSIAALVVAIRAQRANYALAEKLADKPGRLQRAYIQRGGRNASRCFELVVVNGVAATTIHSVWLWVTYFQPPERRAAAILRHPAQFWTGEFDVIPTIVRFRIAEHDFDAFGIAGPVVPLRIEDHDEAVWRMRLRPKLPDGHGATYQWFATTAHGHTVGSEIHHEGNYAFSWTHHPTLLLSHASRNIPQFETWLDSPGLDLEQ